MNGTLPETETLLGALIDSIDRNSSTKVVVCPPFTSLQQASILLKDSPISLGAQNMSQKSSGAFTGETSAAMLLTVGVSHVILGHSERRQYYAETDALVNSKAKAALEAGLTPIICVGETLEEREADRTESVVGAQVAATLNGFTAEMIAGTIIAYEPVWAIGTGKTASPEQAQSVHRFIRDKVSAIDSNAAGKVPILYGGSMKPGNAESLLSQADIDGGLVGGASLKAEDFVAIINAAPK